jgi:drug/metabolite transporter (DMT)-like permease
VADRTVDRRRGVLLIVGAALLWSTGGIGIKALPEAPLKVTFYRSLVASIALLALGRGKLFGQRQWKFSPTFAIALISYAACLTTFVTATKWTTAANAIFIQYAGVIWVMLFAPIVVGEALRRIDIIAIVVALSGMALFFVGRFEMRGMSGNGMAVLSGVFFAALLLAMRREHASGEAAVTFGNLLTAAILLPFVASDLRLSLRSLLILLFLGVFQIALAYLLFVRGLAHVGAVEASLTGMIEPIANPLWVFLIVGERPSNFALAGAAIVLAAIAWHTVRSGREAPELPPPD